MFKIIMGDELIKFVLLILVLAEGGSFASGVDVVDFVALVTRRWP
jgi:hypothetical protein